MKDRELLKLVETVLDLPYERVDKTTVAMHALKLLEDTGFSVPEELRTSITRRNYAEALVMLSFLGPSPNADNKKVIRFKNT